MADSTPITQEVLNGLTDMVRKHGLSYLGRMMADFADSQGVRGPSSDKAASEVVGRVVNHGRTSVSGWMMAFFEMFLAEYGPVNLDRPIGTEAEGYQEQSALLLKQRVEVTGRGEVVAREATAEDMEWKTKFEDMREEALRYQAEVRGLTVQVERLKATVAQQEEALRDDSMHEVHALARRVVLAEASDSDLLALARLLLKEEVG